MKSKRGPVILIVILVAILLFILGVEYGKKVKVTNEVMQILVSITPPAGNTKITTKPIQYEKFYSKVCGFSFIYPDNVKLDKVSSNEASLKSGTNEDLAYVACTKAAMVEKNDLMEKTATQSMTLDNQKTIGRLNQSKKTNEIKFEVKIGRAHV